MEGRAGGMRPGTGWRTNGLRTHPLGPLMSMRRAACVHTNKTAATAKLSASVVAATSSVERDAV